MSNKPTLFLLLCKHHYSYPEAAAAWREETALDNVIGLLVFSGENATANMRGGERGGGGCFFAHSVTL